MTQYKIEVFLPEEFIEPLIDKISLLGACKVGEYDHVASYMKVKGCWRPLNASNPIAGEKGVVNYGEEYKLEIRSPEHLVKEVVKTIKRVHPYDEVLYNIILLHNHLFEESVK